MWGVQTLRDFEEQALSRGFHFAKSLYLCFNLEFEVYAFLQCFLLYAALEVNGI